MLLSAVLLDEILFWLGIAGTWVIGFALLIVMGGGFKWAYPGLHTEIWGRGRRPTAASPKRRRARHAKARTHPYGSPDGGGG